MSKRIYVTFHEGGQQRKKLLKLDDERTFTSITTTIIYKFSLPSYDDQTMYVFKGKVEQNGPFVEIDKKDDDVLEDVVEMKFEVSVPTTSQHPTSPASTISYSEEPLQTWTPSANVSIV